MNAIRSSILLIFLTSFSFSQTKNDDAYFIFNENEAEYKLLIYKYKAEITMFGIYNRKQFEEREEQIKKDKKKGTYNEFNIYDRPVSYLFRVKNKKKERINSCKIKELNMVNYEWLINNSWKENNPNVIFKDLYFLVETNNKEFVKYKVERTLLAY